MIDTYLNPAQLAARLQICTKTIYRAINAGNLASIKVGNRIRVSDEAAKAWISTLDRSTQR